MSHNLFGVPEVPELDPLDRLFVPTAEPKDRMSVACLNFGHPEIGYVNGFRMIADLAVQHVLDTGNDQDYLVYPIVFSYRQYLELRIKGLLGDASQLLDAADPPSQLMGSHRLVPLWDILQPLLLRVFPDAAEFDWSATVFSSSRSSTRAHSHSAM